MFGLCSQAPKGRKKKLIFFFWFFTMISSFWGCFEVDFGLSLGRVLCHVYGRFVVSIVTCLSPIERIVSEMSLDRKTASRELQMCLGHAIAEIPLCCVGHYSCEASNFGRP